MKKMMFVLLLIVSIGILAAVESAPSAVVGYVKYDCLAGLNLLALPMNSGQTLVSEVVSSYNSADNIDTVFMWNAAGQYWDFAVNYGSNFFDPDFAVAPGAILYLSTSTPFSFYSLGSLPATNATYSILPGLNTVMVPLNRSDVTLGSTMASEIGTDVIDTIFMWNAPGQYWDFSVNYGSNFFDPDFALTIGTPVYISSSVSATWPSRASHSRTAPTVLSTSKK
jgi:hypothetical protein